MGKIVRGTEIRFHELIVVSRFGGHVNQPTLQLLYTREKANFKTFTDTSRKSFDYLSLSLSFRNHVGMIDSDAIVRHD